jgi:histidinol-phosphate/aromatic aminotransferase/cobyric acid decarboxylase-like protein
MNKPTKRPWLNNGQQNTHHAYHGGAFFNAIGTDFQSLEKHTGIIKADVLDAWFPPAPHIEQKLREHLTFALQTSPPTHSDGLIQAISETRGIPIKNILVGGGSSDLMFAFFPQVIGSQDEVLILDPMYGEYAHIFKNIAVPALLHRHLLKKENNFRVGAAELKEQLAQIQPSVAVIVNPNSPTGQYWDSKEILQLCKEFSETLFVVDETYIDYIDAEHSLEWHVTDTVNLVVIKSMSKVYALSGVRVGYLAAHSQIIEFIRPFIPPWSVSLIGQIAGVEALKAPEYYQVQYKKTHTERMRMTQVLRTIQGITVLEGVANFILIDLHNTITADGLVQTLRKQNIFIRNCDSTSIQFQNDFVRIAIRSPKENDVIIDAVKRALC